LNRDKELPNLDLLRSVAVLSVLADHVTATHGIAQKHPFLWHLGYWGVLLFFVHTSFVLMMSLERLRLRDWQLHWTFYVRRIFRIYPLSLVTVATALIFHIPHRSWDSQFQYLGRKEIISNILLGQNLTLSRSIIGPMWSLPYEIQMYVLLPALFIIVHRFKSAKVLIGIWAAAIASGFLQHWLAYTQLGLQLRIDRLSIAEYAPCFLAGVSAYFMFLRRNEAKLHFWFWPLSLVLITILYCQWQSYSPGKGYVEWACCFVVGLFVVQCQQSAYLWLNRLTHLIAKYSYGLYLGQIPVLWLAFVKLHFLSVWAQWSIFIGLIILVPLISYHLIEKPFIQLGVILTTPRPAKENIIGLADPAAS
jgi:peptidoglycan/LPS O-acetylase OafA/YrhL